MSTVRRRIAAAEACMKMVKPGILSIVLVNDPEGLGEDEGQSLPRRIRFRRQPHESIEVFRHRARTDAGRAGEKVILFGGAEA
jgi:hypothetical protein